jgi:hypothetical protein
MPGAGALAQQQGRVVIFDENDPLGSAYQASSGAAQDDDSLLLSPRGKLPINTQNAYTGDDSGRLTYRHQSGGSWHVLAGHPGFRAVNLSGMDTLALFVNGPEGVPDAELPRLMLEDDSERRTNTVTLGDYLAAPLDADTATWQRASVPREAFTPQNGFRLDRVKGVRFANSDASNDTLRTLWFDGVRATGRSERFPEAPRSLVTRAGDRSVVLHWRSPASQEPDGYRVYRAEVDGPFEPVTSTLTDPHFVDFSAQNGASYRYAVRTVTDEDAESALSQAVSAEPATLSDDEFLGYVQQTAFDYFWREANPNTGLVPDRAAGGGPASIAATGFGLTAITVGIDRGWIKREAGRERVLTTLRTFWNKPQGRAASGTIGYKGFFYHFLNTQTGTRAGSSELSTIDTALLLGGVLHARQYFGGDGEQEADIRALADSIYRRVDWQWAQNRPPRITLAWRPGEGFSNFDWGGYNEAMIIYLLALGSPTHSIEPRAWNSWTSGYDWQTHYGRSFVAFPPLFGHQYTHLWFDFRGIQDDYMRQKGITYFENSRRATLAQRDYAIANPRDWEDYGSNTWGFTASDDPFGYSAHGAPPAWSENGTITPTAPGGSAPFAPEQTTAALRHLYDAYRTELWGRYGFHDALNPSEDWFADSYIGIDQGPFVIMIENERTGSVWQTFMQDEAVQRGLERAGFREIVATEPPPKHAGELRLSGAAPNPFAERATIRYTLPRAGTATLAVYDALGRRVEVLADGRQSGGTHAATFEAAGLPSGVYFCVLRSGSASVRTSMIVAR